MTRKACRSGRWRAGCVCAGGPPPAGRRHRELYGRGRADQCTPVQQAVGCSSSRRPSSHLQVRQAVEQPGDLVKRDAPLAQVEQAQLAHGGQCHHHMLWQHVLGHAVHQGSIAAQQQLLQQWSGRRAGCSMVPVRPSANEARQRPMACPALIRASSAHAPRLQPSQCLASQRGCCVLVSQRGFV